MTVRNFFQPTATPTQGEAIESLLQTNGLRLERIVSRGEASPAGFWYDQPDPEWVVLLRGEAMLLVEGEGEMLLRAGDYLLIPAHCRHRVEQTSQDALWLALHFREGA